MSAFTEPNYEQQQNKIRQMVLAGLQQAQAELPICNLCLNVTTLKFICWQMIGLGFTAHSK